MKSTKYLANLLQNIKQSFVINHHEPHIKQKCDRNGKKYWQAYDPNTKKHHTFSSEQGVRVWIENRHHCFN